jgi:hypothetical protein
MDSQRRLRKPMPARADPRRVSKLLAEARAESLEGKAAVAGLILSGLRTSMNEPTPNERKLAEAVGNTWWGNKATVDLRQNITNDVRIANTFRELADASISQSEPILIEAWKRAMSLEDADDERRLSYLVVQIKRLAEDYRIDYHAKALLGKIISDIEAEPNSSLALESFRTKFLDVGVTANPPGQDESVEPGKGISSYAPVSREQPNPVSKSRIIPGEPTGHEGQTRPRDASPLSEKEAMLRYLRDGSLDLDTISLRHLVRQLGILRGDTRNE